MKRKMITMLLAATMVTGLLAGCGSDSDDEQSSNEVSESSDEEEADDAAEDGGDAGAASPAGAISLSDAGYDFEGEYMLGDFNDHSNNDVPRQGVDTFEDTDIVFVDIDYDQFVTLLEQEGNYLIQLSGSWCHNSRSLSPNSNELAKEYGIDTIYMYDFDLDNNEDGSTFIRMSDGVETIGAEYNYMYGEIVTRYLTNLNDWVEYPEDTEAAITYTNADGEAVTVARLQEPFLFLYNKDNTVDYSDSGNGSTECPILYAFEEMTDRDAEGVYVNEYDEDGEVVTDEDGEAVRVYITDEYKERLREIFDFIKDNDIELSDYTKEDYVRDSFDSLQDAEEINVYMITYRQAEWLLNQDGSALVMFGSPADEATQAVISAVNDYAVENGVRVFLCNNLVENNRSIDTWGFSGRAGNDMFDEEAPIYIMCTNFLSSYLTNVSEEEIQAPYLLGYDKAATDEDGFAAPVFAAATSAADAEAVFTSYTELTSGQ